MSVSPDGSVAVGDIGLGLLEEAAGIEWEFLAEDVDEFRPVDIEGFDAILVFSPAVTARALAGAERLTLLARLGVGYDRIDVEACTDRGVMLTIAPDGVRRPVAAAAMAFVLALAYRLPLLDRLARESRWNEGKGQMGIGLSGRTLGLVGLGNIGREIAVLAKPFNLRVIATDPYADPEDAAGRGVELIELETLLATADFVCVACPLTGETRHLVDADRLALMKPTAYLVNIARGPIVDQHALTVALEERRIAGAALDVFEEEPPDAARPPPGPRQRDSFAACGGPSTDEWALRRERGKAPAAEYSTSRQVASLHTRRQSRGARPPGAPREASTLCRPGRRRHEGQHGQACAGGRRHVLRDDGLRVPRRQASRAWRLQAGAEFDLFRHGAHRLEQGHSNPHGHIAGGRYRPAPPRPRRRSRLHLARASISAPSGSCCRWSRVRAGPAHRVLDPSPASGHTGLRAPVPGRLRERQPRRHDGEGEPRDHGHRADRDEGQASRPSIRSPRSTASTSFG